jgi:hypothetical protein
MNKRCWLGIGIVVGSLLLGCAGDEERNRTGEKRARVACLAEQTKYQDWPALKMTNGIITVVAVPDIGGRVMVYDLNGRSLLYTNPKEYGQVYEVAQKEQDRKWHNWGGYKVWPAPQKDWGGPPDPLGSALDSGQWTGEILSAEGSKVAIRLTSPEDKTVTGLQMSRTLTLFRGSSRVQVEQTFKNVSDKPVRWSVWDVTQVPGALSEGETFTEEARIYFPLNPQSRHPQGYEVQAGEKESKQWLKGVAPGIMGVQYLGETGKIGADSLGGWIAYADQRHKVVYVKTFQVETGEQVEYPDNGSTVEVYTSGDLPYMEVEVLSPIRELQPGESYTFTENWYAATCPGPILAVNEVGLVNTPLTAQSLENTVRLRGTFGVFQEGKASFAFYDQEGQLLARTGAVEVSPLETWALDQVVKLPDDAVRVKVLLESHDRVELGTLAEATLEAAPPEEPAQTVQETATTPPAPEPTAPSPENLPPSEPTEEQEPAAPPPPEAAPSG